MIVTHTAMQESSAFIAQMLLHCEKMSIQCPEVWIANCVRTLLEKHDAICTQMLQTLFPYLDTMSTRMLSGGVYIAEFPHSHRKTYILVCADHVRHCKFMDMGFTLDDGRYNAFRNICAYTYEVLRGTHCEKMNVLYAYFSMITNSTETKFDVVEYAVARENYDLIDQLVRLTWMWDEQKLVDALNAKYVSLLTDVPWIVVNNIVNTMQ